jgi:ferredoxin
VCPTSAIRPITLSEKLGLNEFTEGGPVRIGTAFVDRSKCLPWAMDKPCIVCQENCPVSPKAIYTRDLFSIVRDGVLTVANADPISVEVAQVLEPGRFATGDFYCVVRSGNENESKQIVANTEKSVMISLEKSWEVIPVVGSTIEIQVRLQRPYVDIEKCTGCGICEHECPVSGKRAIRVSAEGESRSSNRLLLLRR